MILRTIKAMADFAAHGVILGWYYGSLMMVGAAILGLVIKGVIILWT